MEPAIKLNCIDDKTYNPETSTPLFDAMGFSINKLKNSFQGQTDYNVLVTIMTDGEENASREFSGNDIKKLVEELRENRWTFTYIGTDHDVEEIASSLSINNTMMFEKNEEDIKNMFLREQDARANYSKRIRFNEDTSSNYFAGADNGMDTERKTAHNSTLPKAGRSWWQKLFGSE